MNIMMLYFHSLKHLKLIQIFNRFEKQFRRLKKCECKFSIRHHTKAWMRFEVNDVSYFGERSFSFLNKKHDVVSWNDTNLEKLWLYNLHYFNELNSVGALSREEQLIGLVKCWIDENPPFFGNGWEPYPISLRVVNWIKYFLSVDKQSSLVLDSLFQQVYALEQQLEYHLLGNHIFANAKALLFAGCFFEGEKADFWLEKALKILDKEIVEQVLHDGGHFELSPMYHNVILLDMLDLYNLINIYPHEELKKRRCQWGGVIEKMLEWGDYMSHPDGEVSFFNDAAMKISPPINVLRKYAQLLGVESTVVNKSGLCGFEYKYLSYSGYVVVNNKALKAILDVAKVGPDYIPGHAHADTLSFELSLFGYRVFVNSGTSLYGVNEERLRQRKTASHNTLEVDGADSSEVWSGFRVARRAYPTKPCIVKNNEALEFACSHDGYSRFLNKVTHIRKWRFLENRIEIIDSLKGQFTSAIVYYHLHPDIHVDTQGREIELTLPTGKKIKIESNCDIELQPSTWHPEFGVSIASQKFVIKLTQPSLEMIVRY
ncbi:heparinase II/III family protein [Aeromonas veronii]|uniref:heparinase II/III family protein n=1 Tax=Aeromonas veronii TaxID=654 RepID=UPI001F353AFC|nr:alginate lyase family protein [Aeromonas veronii]MCF5901567.1 heparinase II/III family protein [Aeromonas veronii]